MPRANNAFSSAAMAALGIAGLLGTSVAGANPPHSTVHHDVPAVSHPDPRASYYPRLLYPSTGFPSTYVPMPAVRRENAAHPSSGLTLPAYRPPPMSRLHLRPHH